MKRFKMLAGSKFALVLALTCCQSVPNHVFAQTILRESLREGVIDLSARGPMPFAIAGAREDLGEYLCQGEIEFTRGKLKGTLIGRGVAVVRGERGERLVANVTWEVAADGEEYRTSRIQFSWADAVKFSDGEIVLPNVDPSDEPQQLVVIAIIAVMIGLLLPAIQK